MLVCTSATRVSGVAAVRLSRSAFVPAFQLMAVMGLAAAVKFWSQYIWIL
jgi:hypothetical protein